MTSWSGHRAGTQSALLDLMTTAQSGRMRFSEAQRALFTACEFWAAVQNTSLPEYLAIDGESYLDAAARAFAAIGLPSTAAILNSARMRLQGGRTESQRVIQELAGALSQVNEAVDLTLERFAVRTRQGE